MKHGAAALRGCQDGGELGSGRGWMCTYHIMHIMRCLYGEIRYGYRISRHRIRGELSVIGARHGSLRTANRGGRVGLSQCREGLVRGQDASGMCMSEGSTVCAREAYASAEECMPPQGTCERGRVYMWQRGVCQGGRGYVPEGCMSCAVAVCVCTVFGTNPRGQC